MTTMACDSLSQLLGLIASLPGSRGGSIEKAKARVRAKVEHPFRGGRRQFDYIRVRFCGLVKRAMQMVTLFALPNQWKVRRLLMAGAGEKRLQ